MSTFVDVHVLQTVPPSNINRDDTGSPKTAVYGGVRRARVSSQAWKRATRVAFKGMVDDADLGVRTKHVVELVAERIQGIDPSLEEVALDLAEKVLNAAGIKTAAPKAKKDAPAGPPESGYLIFFARHQIDRMAHLAIEAHREDRKPTAREAKTAASVENAFDVAMFGRMVADAPDINVDACVQVAHAISVHGVDDEYDYFTAVDDRSPEDNAGAGMIGTVEFNSSTLYRYATVDVDALADALGGAMAAQRAVEAFLQAFVTSMPTGKQNTFANRTLPDAVVVQIRAVQPVNLVGAFEEAVVPRGGRPRLAVAAERLASYAADVNAAYAQPPEASYVVRVGESTAALDVMGERMDLDTLVSTVGGAVGARLEDRP